MIAPDFELDVASRLTFERQLKLLSMNNTTRQRVLKDCAFAFRKAARKNIREQKDWMGKSFEKRKQGKRKMLTQVGRKMSAFATPQQGTVTWRNPVLGGIARAHHEGVDQEFDATQRTKAQGSMELEDPATIEQARALKQAGFRRRQNGRRIVASIKWIRENMHVGHAGLVLRKMRGAGKKKWIIPVPERAFFGQDEREHNHMVNGIFDTVTEGAGIR